MDRRWVVRSASKCIVDFVVHITRQERSQKLKYKQEHNFSDAILSERRVSVQF